MKPGQNPVRPGSSSPAYDPYELLIDVQRVLLRRNIPAALHEDSIGLAREGAEALLEAFGISPVVSGRTLIPPRPHFPAGQLRYERGERSHGTS